MITFSPVDYTDDQIQQLRSHYGIERKMVMYAPGGFDTRKNFDGLINGLQLAFARVASRTPACHR